MEHILKHHKTRAFHNFIPKWLKFMTKNQHKKYIHYKNKSMVHATYQVLVKENREMNIDI